MKARSLYSLLYIYIYISPPEDDLVRKPKYDSRPSRVYRRAFPVRSVRFFGVVIVVLADIGTSVMIERRRRVVRN